jgi:signal transduction histidine kinase
MKIRNRLAFLFAGLVAGLLLCFSGGIYYFTSLFRKNEFYERLREKAVTTSRLLYEARQQITPSTLQLIDEQDSTLLFDEHVTVYGQSGNLIYDSRKTPQPLSATRIERLFQVSDGEQKAQEGEREYLYKAYHIHDSTLIVIVSAIDRYGLSKMNFLTGILSFGWFVSVGIIITAGWIFAGQALEPISDVIQQVESIDSNTLKTRVKAGNERDEIAQLAQTFNRMLDRLHQSFMLEKSFVSNASHELRTPLTIIQGQLEVALMQERDVPEYISLLHSLDEEIRDMSRLANELLEIAMADADPALLPMSAARIDEIALQAEAELLRKNPEYNAWMDFADAPDEESLYFLPVHEKLMKNAFLNLMENACKFSLEKEVYLSISFLKEAIILQFTDHGTGIPEADLPFIFEPFYRSNATRKQVSGHGVGLSLVKRIAHLHGGRIEVSSTLGKGSTFTLVLPRKVEASFDRDEGKNASLIAF